MRSIIIADDHPITLNGVQILVENLGYNVVHTSQNGITAYNAIVTMKPSYAILDLNMPGMSGLEILEKVRKTNKDIRIIIYTMYHEKSFFEKAQKLNVNGYLLKDFAVEELSVCLETIKREKTWFSPKLGESLSFKNADTIQGKLLLLTASERKIISLIANGKNTKDIAQMLFISEKTVENHRSNIIKKLGLPNEQNTIHRFLIQNQINEDWVS